MYSASILDYGADKNRDAYKAGRESVQPDIEFTYLCATRPQSTRIELDRDYCHSWLT